MNTPIHPTSPEHLLLPRPLIPGQETIPVRSSISPVAFDLLTGITLVEAHDTPGTTLGDVVRGAIAYYIEKGDETRGSNVLDLNERLARTGRPFGMFVAMTEKTQPRRLPVEYPLPGILSDFCSAWLTQHDQEQRIITAMRK